MPFKRVKEFIVEGTVKQVTGTDAGNWLIWTPSPGKRICLKYVQISTDTAMLVFLRFTPEGSPLFPARLPANGTLSVLLVGANVIGGVNEALYLSQNALGNVDAFVIGEEVG